MQIWALDQSWSAELARWGYANLHFKGSVLALLVIFFAAYLVEKRELLSSGSRRIGRLHLPDPKHLGPLILIWGGAMLVLFQTRDLGGALLYFTIFLVMLYTATARWSSNVIRMSSAMRSTSES